MSVLLILLAATAAIATFLINDPVVSDLKDMAEDAVETVLAVETQGTVNLRPQSARGTGRSVFRFPRFNLGESGWTVILVAVLLIALLAFSYLGSWHLFTDTHSIIMGSLPMIGRRMATGTEFTHEARLYISSWEEEEKEARLLRFTTELLGNHFGFAILVDEDGIPVLEEEVEAVFEYNDQWAEIEDPVISEITVFGATNKVVKNVPSQVTGYVGSHFSSDILSDEDKREKFHAEMWDIVARAAMHSESEKEILEIRKMDEELPETATVLLEFDREAMAEFGFNDPDQYEEFRLVKRKELAPSRPFLNQVGGEMIMLTDAVKHQASTDRDAPIAAMMQEMGFTLLGHKKNAILVVDNGDALGQLRDGRGAAMRKIERIAQSMADWDRLNPAQKISRKATVAGRMKAKSIWSKMGVLQQAGSEKYSLAHNESVMRRVGVILARKGGVVFEMELGGVEIDSAEYKRLGIDPDGQFAIDGDLPTMMQGSTKDEESFSYHKGTARPQITHDGLTEPQGYAGEGQAAQEFEGNERVRFHVFAVADEHSASMNHQLAAFSSADGGVTYYQNRLDELKEEGTDALLDNEQLGWVELGVEKSDVVNEYNLVDYARKMGVDGFRGMVAGATAARRHTGELERILDDDEILLPRRVMKRWGIEVGDEVRLYRDPGQVNGESGQVFSVAGELKWFTDKRVVRARNAIAISACSEKWLNQGGDHDGDYGLVVPEREAVIGDLYDGDVDDHPIRREPNKEIVLSDDDNNKPGFLDQQGHMALFFNSFGSRFSIGRSVNTAQRLLQYGEMDEHMRHIAHAVAQGSIDDAKHAILEVLLGERWEEMLEVLNEHNWMQDAPDLVGIMSRMKNTPADMTLSRESKTDGNEVKFTTTVVDGDVSVALREGDIIRNDDSGVVLRVTEADDAVYTAEAISGRASLVGEFAFATWDVVREEAEKFLNYGSTHEGAEKWAEFLLEVADQAAELRDIAGEDSGNAIPEDLNREAEEMMNRLGLEGREMADKAGKLGRLWRTAQREKIEAENAGSETQAQKKADLADGVATKLRCAIKRGQMSPFAVIHGAESMAFVRRVMSPHMLEGEVEVGLTPDESIETDVDADVEAAFGLA